MPLPCFADIRFFFCRLSLIQLKRRPNGFLTNSKVWMDFDPKCSCECIHLIIYFNQLIKSVFTTFSLQGCKAHMPAPPLFFRRAGHQACTLNYACPIPFFSWRAFPFVTDLFGLVFGRNNSELITWMLVVVNTV